MSFMIFSSVNVDEAAFGAALARRETKQLKPAGRAPAQSPEHHTRVLKKGNALDRRPDIEYRRILAFHFSLRATMQGHTWAASHGISGANPGKDAGRRHETDQGRACRHGAAPLCCAPRMPL
jgi:hypothetical protein